MRDLPASLASIADALHGVEIDLIRVSDLEGMAEIFVRGDRLAAQLHTLDHTPLSPAGERLREAASGLRASAEEDLIRACRLLGLKAERAEATDITAAFTPARRAS